jgi:hypothetical protein
MQAMKKTAKPPFSLPSEPVDQHEVKWWEVTVRSGIPTVVGSRALYHVRTRWIHLYEGSGVDFVDCWQMFPGGHFSGRNLGWSTWVERQDWNRCYGTEAEAKEHAARWCREILADNEREAAELRQALANLGE